MDSPAPDTAFRSSSEHTRGRSALMRFLGYFSSMKSAAATISLLTAVLAIATVYERDYGREVTAVMIYQAWWFKLIFVALAVNIFGAAAVRFPWRRHQAGFVVVHVGLLTLMLGFALAGGRLDGMLSVTQQTAASRIQLPHDYLGVVAGAKQYSAHFQPLRWAGYPSFARYCLTPVWPYAFPGLSRCDELILAPADVPAIRAVSVVDTARLDPGFVANDGGGPAVKVDLKGRFPGMPMGMLVPVQSGWLSVPDQTDLSTGPATVSLARSANVELLRDFIAKPAELAAPTLKTYWRGKSYAVNVDAKTLPATHDLADDLRLILERAVDRPRRTQTAIEDDPEAAFEPFLAVRVGVGKDPERKWEMVPVFSYYPCYEIVPGQPEFLYDHPGMYRPAAGEQGINLQLIAGPDRCLYARALSRSKGWLSAMSVNERWQGTLVGGVGSPMQVDAALTFLPAAAPGPEPVHVVPDTKDQHSERWIEIDIGGERMWLKRGERKELKLKDGSVFLHYAKAEHDLSTENGFSVQLEKFEEGKDPGGQSSASYASDVTVIGSNGERSSKHITMNEPLTVNGVALYQSSFIPERDEQGQQTGRYLASVFTVATDPGLWIKYAGSAILVFGIILMYMMRR
jgi:hypothetical protein